MKHIQKYESFINEGRGIQGKVTTDKILTQFFGKTIKEFRDTSGGEDDSMQIVFTDGKVLNINASSSEPMSSAQLGWHLGL